jgi:uncharacterized protein (TIGR02996 family)
MSAYEGLLQAIRETPEDDTPRLVLSDWLDENGEPERAELIRIQCLLARLSADHDSRPELEARERGLLLLNEQAWAQLPASVEGHFQRGFLERVTATPLQLLRQASPVLESGHVRDLTLREANQFRELERVLAHPGIRLLRRLTIESNRLHQAGFLGLLEPLLFGHLEELTLRCPQVSRPGLRRLGAALSHLKRLVLDGRGHRYHSGTFDAHELDAILPRDPSSLQRLEFVGLPLGVEEISLLRRCPHLPHLRHLRVTDARLNEEALRLLSAATFAGQLEHLDVSENRISGSPEVLLHDRSGFRSLRCLNLRGCEFDWTPEPTPYLGSPHLEELSINLPYASAGRRGLARWLWHPALAGLHTLRLGAMSRYYREPESTDLTDELMAALADSHCLGRLRHLSLDAEVSTEQFARLLAGPNARNWRSLEIVNGRLDDGLEPLVASTFEPQLRRLSLRRCQLTDSDVIRLAGCPWLSDLRELDLSDNRLGDEGARALVCSPYLKQLTSLNLTSNSIRDGGCFVGSYLANPAILNLSGNYLGSGATELLHAGVEHLRRSSLAPLIAQLLGNVSPAGAVT